MKSQEDFFVLNDFTNCNDQMIFTRLSDFIFNKVSFFIVFYTLIFISEGINISFYEYSYYLLIFFLSFIGIGVFGYLINDISDLEQDKIVGKKNIVFQFSKTQQFFICLIFLLVGFIPITATVPETTFLLVFEVILLLLYSIPPLRLKERGFLGIVTDSLYAYVLPLIIMLVYISSFINVKLFYLIFLPIFGLGLGIKNILNHQLEDYDNDLISNTQTFTTKNYKLSFFLKLTTNIILINIWLGAFVFLIINSFPNITIIFFLLVGFIFLFKIVLFSFYNEPKYLGFPENNIIYIGSFLILIFVVFQKNYQFLLIAFTLFNPYVRIQLLRINNLLVKFYVLNRQLLSYIVNYSIYYSFLFFGVNLKEKAEKRKQAIKLDELIIYCTSLVEKNVHGLWIGNQLSNMEILTIHSFIAQGYKFHLWTYEPLKNTLPKECVVCDANDIIPFERVFKYKYSSQFGTGKGSYAGFSDIFRYKLLYEKGGWWVDMDVTCLKPFDVDSPYFFRAHHDLPLVGNIMKAPQGSALMLKCYEEASREVDENNRDWHKPIAILVKNVFEFELQKFIVRDVSNTDEWYKIKPFVYSNKVAVPENWFFVHWCNEVWRTNGYDKGSPLYSSFYGQLLVKYKLIPILPRETWKENDRKLKVRLTVERILDYI